MSNVRRTVSCYEGRIPPFVESEINRLYGERYSSLALFRIYGIADDVCTYMAREGAETKALFLFRRVQKKVHVLNEGVHLDGAEARYFSAYIFGVYRSVNAVVFEAIHTSERNIPFHHQHFPCAEDTVLMMPDTVDCYVNSLGKSTRENLKRYLAGLQRDFPSFKYLTYDRHEADEQDIRHIIRLNRGRMTRKNKVSSIGDEEEDRILLSVRECGFVGIVTINGECCAGVITYRFGKNFSMRILSHAPAFDKYRLGLVCCYLTICECIGQGTSGSFNFGWGEYAYKYRLGGTRRQLSRLVIHRSFFQMLSSGRFALHIALHGHAYRVKQWILKTAKQDAHVLSRPVRRVLHALRWLKAERANG